MRRPVCELTLYASQHRLVVVAMRTTKTILLLLVTVEREDHPAEPVPAIETTGELVRARPIRKYRTASHAEELEAQLDGLARWLGKAAS